MGHPHPPAVSCHPDGMRYIAAAIPIAEGVAAISDLQPMAPTPEGVSPGTREGGVRCPGLDEINEPKDQGINLWDSGEADGKGERSDDPRAPQTWESFGLRNRIDNPDNGTLAESSEEIGSSQDRDTPPWPDPVASVPHEQVRGRWGSKDEEWGYFVAGNQNNSASPGDRAL